MDLTPTADQSALVTWAEELAEAEFPLERFAHLGSRGLDSGVAKLAELGWLALGVPETAGGSGLTVIEEILVTKAAGRWLPSPALIANVLAAHLAVAGGKPELATAFAALDRRAAFVFPAAGPAFLIGGGAAFAIDPDGADHFIIFDGERLSLVPSDGIISTAVQLAIDDRVAMDRVFLPPGVIQSDAPSAALWLRAQLLVAALLVGAGEGALAMAVDYAKMREQFGKPIGSFQAIKHKCADMALQLASARSQMIFAAAGLNEDIAGIRFQVAAARSLAGQAAVTASYANVQIHGGIGFTSECHAQRFVKRITLLNMLGGGARAQREALIEETARAA